MGPQRDTSPVSRLVGCPVSGCDPYAVYCWPAKLRWRDLSDFSRLLKPRSSDQAPYYHLDSAYHQWRTLLRELVIPDMAAVDAWRTCTEIASPEPPAAPAKTRRKQAAA